MQFSSAVTTVTRTKIPKRVYDTVTLGTPGLQTFLRTAKEWTSGTKYEPIIKYQDTTNGGNTGIADQLDSNRQNTRVNMSFEVKGAYKPVVIANIEQKVNDGDERLRFWCNCLSVSWFLAWCIITASTIINNYFKIFHIVFMTSILVLK